MDMAESLISGRYLLWLKSTREFPKKGLMKLVGTATGMEGERLDATVRQRPAFCLLNLCLSVGQVYLTLPLRLKTDLNTWCFLITYNF